MGSFAYLGIFVLLALASQILAFEEEPYDGVVGENDDGEDYGGPPMDEWPHRRQGGTIGKGRQCRANNECRDRLNCCRTTGSLRTQCWPCLGRNQACQVQTDCAHPLVCSQKIDPRSGRAIGRRRCVALNLNGPPPANERIVGRRPGK